MIDFDDACLKALDYLKRNYGIDTVDDPLDVGDEWVFSGFAPNSILLTAPNIAISKATGEIRDFLDFMPDDKKLMERAQPLEFPRKFRWEFREKDALRKACEMALDYMQEKYKLSLIGNPTDVGDAWVFMGLDENKGALEAPSVAVSKATGHVRSFPFFAEENVRLLQNGKTLNFPEGFQKSNGTQGKLVTFEDVCKRVSKRFLDESGFGAVTRIVDMGDTWVFFGYRADWEQSKPRVEVSKESGEIFDFDFPFGDTRKRLEKGFDVEIPEWLLGFAEEADEEIGEESDDSLEALVETKALGQEDESEEFLPLMEGETVDDAMGEFDSPRAAIQLPKRPTHFVEKTSRIKWLHEQFD